MKLRHKVPYREPRSAVVDDSYENEVRRSTEKLERLHTQAQKRFEQAQQRLNRARKKSGAGNRKRQIADLEAIVELRRIELQKYQWMMAAVPASAEHRGNKSFRPVGFGGGVL